jgi:CRP/FNR family nitrogen fixation transcriptional regulator
MPSTLSHARADAGKNMMALTRQDLMGDTGEGPATLTDYLRRIQDFGSRLHFQRNELIFNQDDGAEYFYRILSGTVRLCRYMPDGRRYIVDFNLPGDVIGLNESPDHPVSAEAVTDVILVAYPRICFDRLARECPELRTQHLCHLSANLLSAQQHLFVLGCQKAKERIASFLLRLADRMDLGHGDRLDLAMGRQDIADHLGLTIETISRSITALRAEGAVLVPNTHQLVLRDMTILRALAAED